MAYVAIDAGHGGFGVTPGKRTPDGEYEWNFNNKVAVAAIAKLQANGVKVLRTDDPTGHTDVPLITRTNKANTAGVDVFVSLHHNASTGKWGTWTGTETFTYNGSQPQSEKLAAAVHSRVLKAYGLKDRGLKKENFHVVRETHMPAILVEGGYMDSTIDILKLRSDAVLKAAGEAVADGIMAYFGITPKTSTPAPAPTQPAPSNMYRIRKTWADAASQIGAFSDLNNAKSLADKNPGYIVFDETGKALYQFKPKVVQPAPAPAPKPVAPKPAPTPVVPAPAPTPAPAPVVPGHPILGKSVAVAEQMSAFVKAVNPSFDIAIAQAYLKVGEKYGIRGDVAFSQSLIETGYFKFTGGTAVTLDQHNYCGMGVTSKGMKGNSFATIEDGVTAQMQHLLAYASKNAIPAGDAVLDPRFALVTRGIAPNWEDLNNRWAMNSQYGQSILAVYEKLMATPIPVAKPVESTPIPVVEKPAVQPVPVVEKPAPTPVVETPAPVEAPKVEEPTPAPAEDAPNPDEKINGGLVNRVLQAILDFLKGFLSKKN